MKPFDVIWNNYCESDLEASSDLISEELKATLRKAPFSFSKKEAEAALDALGKAINDYQYHAFKDGFHTAIRLFTK